METEYRCYTFGNMYLSSIQQGIQAAHAIAELAMKTHLYDGSREFAEWALSHKTIVCLNAGDESALLEIETFFAESRTGLPWAAFRESKEALGGSLTCLAIIIPSNIYDISRDATFTYNRDAMAYLGDNVAEEMVSLTDFEHRLLQLLRRCRLAR